MKKNRKWTTTLICLLCVALLAGCGSSKSPEEEMPEEPVPGPSAGGWTVSTEPVSPVIPEEAREAFDAALAGLTGAKYEPVAYLGSQVVAGLNFGFLCRVSAVTPQAEAKLCVVKVFRDLEGNASILDTKDVTITDYVNAGEVSFTPGDLAGGWSLTPDMESAALPEDVQTAFDKAMADFSGVGYHPLAYLGSQVVAGSNYAVLCNAVTVTAQPQSALAVVVIYADLEGGAQVTSVSGFDFP